MKDIVKNCLTQFKNYRRRQHRKTALILTLSIFVVTCVSWSLHLNGESMAPDTYCNNTEPSHTHTLSCYSDSEADIETEEDWEKSVSDVTLTGICSDDVIAVAKTQLGYSESTANYNVETDSGGIEVMKGYTRYGAMYGNAYADWDAAFVSFCLKYACVPKEEFPYETTVSDFIKKLSDSEYNLYMEASEYEPAAGDAVFFDTDKDGAADHMGLVSELLEDTDKDGVISNSIRTIEGDISEESGGSDTEAGEIKEKEADRVAERTYSSDDETIAGYGKLSGIKSEIKECADEQSKEEITTDTYESVNTDNEAEPVSRSAMKAQKSASSETAEVSDVQADILSAQSEENTEIEEVSFNANSGSRTYQAHFERAYDIAEKEINYAIHVGDKVILEIANMEYSKEAVDEAVKDNGVVNVATSASRVGTSAFSGETEFQTIEFTALNKGETRIVLDGVMGSHEFTQTTEQDKVDENGDKILDEEGNPVKETITESVRRDFRGKKITLNIRVYDAGEVLDYTGVYDPESEPHHHIDVEVEALFNIHIYDADGNFTTIKPDNVHIEKVYATVYNTAALIDIDGYAKDRKKWDETLLEQPVTDTTEWSPDRDPKPEDGSYTLQNLRKVKYNGSVIDAYDLSYRQKDTSGSTGQYEFKCDGWGWHTLYDGDTIEMNVEVTYEHGGEKYSAKQVVVVPVCLGFSACPASTWNNVNHGFDVKVDMNDIVETKASHIYKIDQYDNPVAGASFKFVSAEEGNNNTIELTTDENGVVTFYNEDGSPMNLKQIKDKLGTKFTMEEISVPAGYRKMPAKAEFEIIGNDESAAGGNFYLMCTNPYETGVWANPSARVEAPQTLYRLKQADGTQEAIQYYTRNDNGEIEFNGKLYGVIMKRIVDELSEWDTWKPVYGNDIEGYNVAENTSIEGVKELLAKEGHPGLFEFGVSDSGMFVSATVKDLPGDPRTYYTFLHSNGSDTNEAEYVVAYYYQPNGSDDIVQIVSHEDNAPSDGVFNIYWGSTIEVSNFENRLYFQKLDTTNHQISDAIFAMYDVGEDDDGKIYYTTQDNYKVYLGADTDGDNKGTAVIYIDGTQTAAEYEINTPHKNFSAYEKSSGYITEEGVGDIIIKCGGNVYTVKPAKNVEGRELVGYTHDACSKVSENGTGHFEKLTGSNESFGRYILREIQAPKGYGLNTTEIKVAINDSGVFSYAGDNWYDDDNVLVGNGLGYLAANMTSLATEGVGNETLRWMFTKVGIIGGSGNNTEESYNAPEGFSTFKYFEKNYMNPDGALKKIDGLLAGHSNGSTRSNSNALVNYLVYEPDDKNVLFNYKPNEDQTARSGEKVGSSTNVDLQAGSGTTRLYTTYGWSILEAYQDYAYGQANSSVKTKYTDMQGKNLAYMFSDSVFVAVKDKAKVDLTLLKRSDKKDEYNNNTPLDGAKFVLYRETSENGETVKEYYKYDNEEVSWVKSADEAAVDTATDKFTGFMIPLPEEYKLAKDESMNIKMEYESTGCMARIYLTEGNKDNRTSDIIGPNSATVEGTIKATGNCNYIYIKGENYDSKFTSLKVKSITLTKDDNETTLNIKPSDVTIVDMNGSKVTKGDDGSISYGIKSGYISFKDLDEGTYYLEEIEAPTGHTKLEEPVKVTVGPQWGGDNGAPFVTASGGWNAAEFDNSSPYYDSESKGFQYGLTVVDESKGIDLTVNKKSAVPGESGVTPLEGAEFVLYYQTGEDKYYYTGEYNVPLNNDTVWVKDATTEKTLNSDGTFTINVKQEDSNGNPGGEFGFAFPQETWELNHIKQVNIEYTDSSIPSCAGYVEHYGTSIVGWINGEDAAWTSPKGLGTGAGTITLDAQPGQNIFSTVRMFGIAKDQSITIKSVKLIPDKTIWKNNIETATRFSGSTFTVQGLPDGTYYMHEEVVPDGYNKPAQDVEIKIKDGIVTGVNNSGDNSIQEVPAEGVTGYSINIINTAGYELPATGGIGTQLYTFGGLLLITAPLLYGCVARRRRERRIE